MLQNKVMVIALFSIVALVYGGYFCRYYIVDPGREAAKHARGLDTARSYYLEPGASQTLDMKEARGPEDELLLRYLVQGDEQAKQELVAKRKALTRRKHPIMIVVSLVIACLSGLIALGAGLTMRQPRGWT